MWISPVVKRQSLLEPWRFSFLHEEHELSNWNDKRRDKLWLYNLHYFDDLNAEGAEGRKDWHADLIEKWIDENPPGYGIGWEPYPISLRIVNWIKWVLAGNDLSKKALHSLAVQVRHLSKRLEKHLMGNHLLANGKALLFAGCYFQSPEANKWKDTGERILFNQLNEQILPDGGHFERSPMYHSIVLEDILDCLNLLYTFGQEGSDLHGLLATKAIAMLAFLSDILHPDGEIPFFNDSAIDVAPIPVEIFSYAGRLGITAEEGKGSDSNEIIGKSEFGLYVLKKGDIHVIVDAGAIGPDYLPGHAHCDTLSYEMSINGKRFIVNSGTYSYEGPDRHRFRSTEAHNTVRLDGEEQHEIWDSFRVARRGYPIDVRVEENGDEFQFAAAHTGYRRLKGSPVHRRKMRLGEEKMSVEDTIEGTRIHRAESFVHLHPDVKIVEKDVDKVLCDLDGRRITIRCTSGGSFKVENSRFSPEFGKKVENKVLVLGKRALAPFVINYEILIH